MEPPLVDVSIAVHSASRPIRRAVSSVLDGTRAPVRVTVIAHNIDPGIIRANLGELAGHDRVRMLTLADGIPSPAGPLNLGLESATAPFSSVMGSDDEFETGAIDSWLAMQERSGAAMVLARIHHEGRGDDSYPPVRPGRRTRLDGVRDRLPYRSAPLGLVSREHFGELRFTAGLSSGEDLAYVTRVWFSGLPIAFDAAGPAYLIHSDESDRVTAAPRPVTEDFLFLDEVYGTEAFERLTPRQREVLALKFIRLHVFDAVLGRTRTGTWDEASRASLTSVIDRILETSRRAESLLSRADRDVLDAIRDPVGGSRIPELLARRWRYRTPAAVLPRNPLRALDRQAPLRTLAAGVLVMRAHRGA